MSRGNRRDYALGRLAKERPDLAQKVEAGEMSAYQAMVEAKLRKRTITLQLEPRAFVRAI